MDIEAVKKLFESLDKCPKFYTEHSNSIEIWVKTPDALEWIKNRIHFLIKNDPKAIHYHFITVMGHVVNVGYLRDDFMDFPGSDFSITETGAWLKALLAEESPSPSPTPRLTLIAADDEEEDCP